MRIDGARQLEQFRRYLGERGLPATRQRLAVAEVLCFSADHLSVEEVARRVRQGGTMVGTATVYRTLHLLVQSGLVREHDFGEGFRRFEPVAGGRVHEHCVCTACGRVEEFSSDRLERMIGLLAEEVEFRPHHHRLEVCGLCRACQEDRPLTHVR